MTSKCCVFWVILALVLANTCFGGTIYNVGGTGGAYTSIQDAIHDAASGDEIEVAPGIYCEQINLKGKAIRLYSADGPGLTTIDGNRQGTVITCNSNEDSGTIIEGFTITGGSANEGGGMYNEDSSPTVTNCTFSGNTSKNGGGMCNRSNNSSSPTVTDCAFSSNTASSFGGGMCNWSSSPIVTNCTFSDNAAEDYYGGGMYNNGTSSQTIANCTFSGNTSKSGGGMYNKGNSSQTITNCTFNGNIGEDNGGGMCNWSSSPTVTNCMFSDNNKPDSYGGGMYNHESSPTVINCTFSRNDAYSGGGICNWKSSSPTVINCTFSYNTARIYGGAVYNFNGSSPTVTNCILWGGANSIYYGSTGEITYSNVQGGRTGEGNINLDPLFSDSDGRLSADSPCIDAGDDNAVPPDILFDLDGNPRVLGKVDMGAYESSSNSPPAADVGGPYLTAIGTPCSFDGRGSDDPDGDVLTFDWDCGDGGTETGETPTHTYSSVGIYDVCLTVSDGVESDTKYSYAVVYDPEGGFVTGGGWISSPAGAYAGDTSLAGKANFGFVSKYKKGAQAPTGNTEFVFQAANLSFHSSSYQWLVVNQGGANAQFKGTGTINGAGDYKFMLWAGDGEPDIFRIKIWEELLGEEIVYYDNGEV